MESDASPFVPTLPSPSPSPLRKKSFYVEEEDIEIKPSPELIPDEYEHNENESVLFHIFRTDTPQEEELSEMLLECVKNIDYCVEKEKNLHSLNKLSEFTKDLEAIKTDAGNKNALVLVFIGYFGDEDGTLCILEEEETSKSNYKVKDVWNFFASHNCPELKYKPKIFIFCTSGKPRNVVQTDSMRHYSMKFDQVYDFPAESDILIVYEKINDPWSSSKRLYIEKLCDNITTYSKKYDIIDLISYIEHQKTVPLVISTLTRKFYLTPNKEREHALSIIENQSFFETTLQKIHDDIEKLHETQKKKKDKMFSFSFKKKPEDKPKIIKRAEKDKPEEPKTPKASGTKPAASSVANIRKTQTLEADSSSTTKKTAKKPIWKI